MGWKVFSWEADRLSAAGTGPGQGQVKRVSAPNDTSVLATMQDFPGQGLNKSACRDQILVPELSSGCRRCSPTQQVRGLQMDLHRSPTSHTCPGNHLFQPFPALPGRSPAGSHKGCCPGNTLDTTQAAGTEARHSGPASSSASQQDAHHAPDRLGTLPCRHATGSCCGAVGARLEASTSPVWPLAGRRHGPSPRMLQRQVCAHPTHRAAQPSVTRPSPDEETEAESKGWPWSQSCGVAEEGLTLCSSTLAPLAPHLALPSASARIRPVDKSFQGLPSPPSRRASWP